MAQYPESSGQFASFPYGLTFLAAVRSVFQARPQVQAESTNKPPRKSAPVKAMRTPVPPKTMPPVVKSNASVVKSKPCQCNGIETSNELMEEDLLEILKREDEMKGEHHAAIVSEQCRFAQIVKEHISSLDELQKVRLEFQSMKEHMMDTPFSLLDLVDVFGGANSTSQPIQRLPSKNVIIVLIPTLWAKRDLWQNALVVDLLATSSVVLQYGQALVGF